MLTENPKPGQPEVEVVADLLCFGIRDGLNGIF